ncbi:MAG: porin [Ignavibacteria bacterium]|nr:MAG: porin [Ignavibacteria bacterium]KAF0156888.1 MAG: porin [Ignavibacteria bacterium]
MFVLILFLYAASLNGQSLVFENSVPDKNDTENEKIEFNSLTGDWWGTRTSLYKSGYQFSFSMKNDFFSSHSAKSRGFDYLNMFTLNSSLDLNELFCWNNADFFAEVIGLHGTAPEDKIGPLQGISNITSPHQWRLYQLWIEKKFAGNSISVLAGLFDLNSEFDVRSTTDLFINPAFGIGPDFSGSGLNGPSIFPSTSMAVRVNYCVNENVSFKIGIFDAVPENYNQEYLKDIFNLGRDGVLLIGQADYTKSTEEVREGFEKYSIGGWYYPQSFDDLAEVDQYGNPITHFGNSGVYFNAEKFVLSKHGSPQLGLSFFGRIGFANKNINAVQTFWAFGFNFSGALSSSPEEILGFAIANARLSSKFITANSLIYSNAKFNETIFELTYSFNLLNWLCIQPDLQYVINPAEGTSRRAFIAGVRIIAEF